MYDDYAVTTHTRQAVLREIHGMGFSSVAEFSRETGATVAELIGATWKLVHNRVFIEDSPFWNGKGKLREDQVYFTKRDGTLVGRPYLRSRAMAELKFWFPWSLLVERQKTIAQTIDNDKWLAPCSGMLVTAVCRSAAPVLREISMETLEKSLVKSATKSSPE